MKIFITLMFVLSVQVFAQAPEAQWFLTRSPKIQGHVLIIHGLNFKPEKMDQIIHELNQRGHQALLLRLIGHSQDMERMKKVTYQEWQKQVEDGYKELRGKNLKEGGKISFVGFSLGATLEMDLLANSESLQVDQAMLFSPALSVKKTSHLVKLLSMFGREFIVPSLSPADYRAQKGTSLSAYFSLFESIERFEKGNLLKVDIPTVIFIDEKDELVSFDGLRNLIESFRNWQMITVSNDESTLEKSYHHLTIDPQALGLKEWNKKVLPEFDRMFGPFIE